MSANPTEARGASRLFLVGLLTGLTATLSPLPVHAAEDAAAAAGQRYVAEGPFASDYYYSPTYTPTVEGSNKQVIVGQTLYYQVSYNHRFAFVKASDVDVVAADPKGGRAAE